MILSDPVGAGEIAQRAGVVKATVWSWQKRHGDFPVPVQLKMGPVWDWPEVETWLRAHGKTAQAEGPKELYLGHARSHTPVLRYGGGYHPPVGWL